MVFVWAIIAILFALNFPRAFGAIIIAPVLGVICGGLLWGFTALVFNELVSVEALIAFMVVATLTFEVLILSRSMK